MFNYVMKGLRFADNKESFFEAWNRSHVGCSAQLFFRFADTQESRFQASKRSNMCSALLHGGGSADFPNYVYKLQNVQIWTVSNCKGVYLLIVRNAIFRL